MTSQLFHVNRSEEMTSSSVVVDDALRPPSNGLDRRPDCIEFESLVDAASSSSSAAAAGSRYIERRLNYTDCSGGGTSGIAGGEPEVEAIVTYAAWQATSIAVLCAFIVCGTIVGNVLVCTAVAIVRKLRTPSNLLIVSLAVSDLLVAVLVMPPAVAYELLGRWPLGRPVCDAWTSLDVMLCTASILNLCTISVDRYLVITRPLQYAVKRTPGRMAAMVVGVWTLSAVISIPPLFGWRAPAVAGQCSVSQAVGYQIYATVGAFYLPLTIMIVIYYRIYMVSSRIADAEARSKPAVAPPTMATTAAAARAAQGRNTSADSSTPLNASVCVGGCASSTTTAHVQFDEDRMRNFVYGAAAQTHQLAAAASNSKKSKDGAAADDVALAGLLLTAHRKRFRFLEKSRLNRIASSKDRKATKTLGVIMGAFTACWLPFFILAVIKPFCTQVR